MKTTIKTVQQIFSYLSDEMIDKISEEVNVDYQVKYLTAKDVLYLLIYSHFNTKNISLRQTNLLSKTMVYQFFAGKSIDYSVPHTTLSDRLNTIKPVFFESIYYAFLEKLSSMLPPEEYKKRKIIRYDSTFVSLSSKLLQIGMQNGRKPQKDKPVKNQIKFTIGFDGLYPSKSKIYTEQTYLSDEVSFAEIIQQNTISSSDISVFDRGAKKRKTLKDFWEKDIYFVTRADSKIRYKEIPPIPFSKNNIQDTENLIFKKDIVVNLYDSRKKIYKLPFRLIIFTSKQTGEDVLFLTNIFNLLAVDISEIYKMRWDIEVFFKFLKQELNFKHFLSRSENGIQVSLYITLIISIMLLIYKKSNKLTGYKLTKLKFYYELEQEVIKIAVILCGGNPELLEKFERKKGFGQ